MLYGCGTNYHTFTDLTQHLSLIHGSVGPGTAWLDSLSFRIYNQAKIKGSEAAFSSGAPSSLPSSFKCSANPVPCCSVTEVPVCLPAGVTLGHQRTCSDSCHKVQTSRSPFLTLPPLLL